MFIEDNPKKYTSMHQRACVFHLKDNLKTLDSATQVDLTTFDRLIHAPTEPLFFQVLD